MAASGLNRLHYKELMLLHRTEAQIVATIELGAMDRHLPKGQLPGEEQMLGSK